MIDNYIDKIFLEKFNDFSLETIRVLNENENFINEAQLYHYTSLEALQAIIKNQSLRATSLLMMNDPNELIHGLDQINNWYHDNLGGKLRNAKNSNFSAFIFSLSELKDDMNQWEKYGDNHKGIRIGFSIDKTIKYWRRLKNVDVLLFPVIYHEYSDKYIGEYSTAFLKFKKEFSQAIVSYFIEKKDLTDSELNKLVFYNSIIASLIKRKEWASEKEWRIICIPQGPYNKNIIGEFYNGKARAKLENKDIETLKMLTNDGLGAYKNILKIGCKAGNKEDIQYVLELLFRKQNQATNFIISKSEIQTR